MGQCYWAEVRCTLKFNALLGVSGSKCIKGLPQGHGASSEQAGPDSGLETPPRCPFLYPRKTWRGGWRSRRDVGGSGYHRAGRRRACGQEVSTSPSRVPPESLLLPESFWGLLSWDCHSNANMAHQTVILGGHTCPLCFHLRYLEGSCSCVGVAMTTEAGH